MTHTNHNQPVNRSSMVSEKTLSFPVRRWAPTALGAVLLIAASAKAGVSVNGIGFGTARADVWGAPNSPPNAPTHTVTASTLWPTVMLGPGLVNCDPQTFVIATAVSPQPFTYEFNLHGRALGGDKIGSDGADLYPYITTVSPDASGDMTLSAIFVGNVIHFFGTFTSSDSGVAGRIQLIDGSDLNEPHIIYEELFLNHGADRLVEGIDFTQLFLGRPEDLIIRADMFGSSVPTPGSAVLLASGGLVATLRRRAR